ncbi:SDR family oxidoreductase [Alteromonas facilis]|uniref:SDR family oxidoreductase n=1 Tax=Alteromonas facilis TaxID=2048004 RepID=UPI000C29222A|nr:SDR family oxidoreductase [Alteromonas facilis]
MARLKGKVALITGAAQGIGEAVATLFANQGARVILSDIQDEKGQLLANKLGENCRYVRLDVKQESDWQSVIDYIKTHYDGLDILVNNAGITGFLETEGVHDPEHFNLDSWRTVMQTNIEGVALGCKHAISLMKDATAASIVNISSRSGLVGIPTAAAYAASKAAVRNHSKSVALYCAENRYPIRCNSIHPGAILTPMWDMMLGEGEQRQNAIDAVAADIPLGHMGEAIDVAYAALYLASDEAKYVTGIELNIDGGILAGSTAAPKQ